MEVINYFHAQIAHNLVFQDASIILSALSCFLQ